MPLNDAAPGPPPSNRPKKANPGRVVPAIPLAFSKPKAARPPTKSEQEEQVSAVGQSAVPNASVRNDAGDDSKSVGKEDDAKSTNNPATVRKAEQFDQAHGHHAVLDPASAMASQHKDDLMHPNGDEPAGSAPSSFAIPPIPPRSGHADTSNSTTRTSPEGSRKPTDRFDMRPIRTELPPAFVPSADQHTPQSTTSSQARPPPNRFPHAHPHHSSVGSIVFGGQDSGTPSPAPPPASTSAFIPPPYATQATYYGHAHHSSEPPAQRVYHSNYPPPTTWNPRPGGFPTQPHAQTFYHSHSHVPFRYPPRDMYSPAGAPHPNGYSSRSPAGSQSSSTAQEMQKPYGKTPSPAAFESSYDNAGAAFRDPRISIPHQGHGRDAQLQQQMPAFPPPSAFPTPDMATGFENAESLRDHIFAQLFRPELADCSLDVSEDYGEARQHLEGHTIVLARSPYLFDLIRQRQSSDVAASRTQIKVRLQDRFVRVHSFVDAVRYLYGGPLPTLDVYSPGKAAGVQGSANEVRMERALQHIATASLLGIAALGQRGVDLAMDLLHWDTIVPALAFATEGGVGPMWTVDDGSEERTSTCSSEDSFGKPEMSTTPKYDPHASNLLHRILDFAVHKFPSNFYLDAAAPQLSSCPRLPLAQPGHESKSSRSDPRLSQIRFGDVPIEDHQRPSFATTTISSLLLSLPFPLLKFLLEHPDLPFRLGIETAASIMRQVITERERRRQKALKARSVLNHTEDGAEVAAVVQNLYWEEFVEPSPQHRTGFRLARKRRGIDTPPSSGAEEERRGEK